VLTLITISSIAQGKLKDKADQVKSLKVAHITNELSLTPEESAKFWPVYNEFESRQREIRRKKSSKIIDRRDDETLNNLTEKEASAILVQMESDEDQLHQLRKKLLSDLRPVISAVKILKLKKAEEDFNRKLLKQYRDKARK
jgi:Spy/CpxP family protein refolding chaperone